METVQGGVSPYGMKETLVVNSKGPEDHLPHNLSMVVSKIEFRR